jgi:hypothetical protein
MKSFYICCVKYESWLPALFFLLWEGVQLVSLNTPATPPYPQKVGTNFAKRQSLGLFSSFMD